MTSDFKQPPNIQVKGLSPKTTAEALGAYFAVFGTLDGVVRGSDGTEAQVTFRWLADADRAARAKAHMLDDANLQVKMTEAAARTALQLGIRKVGVVQVPAGSYPEDFHFPTMFCGVKLEAHELQATWNRLVNQTPSSDRR